jgi:hypothetical protein
MQLSYTKYKKRAVTRTLQTNQEVVDNETLHPDGWSTTDQQYAA